MWNPIARLWKPPAPEPRLLADERQSHFFTWFHLDPAGEPVAAGGGAWHCFRPAGAAFRALAELDIKVDGHGAIEAAVLGLDRGFIDGRNGAFARDIAKSFLGWILPPADRQRVFSLIANIESLRALAAPVLVRGRLPEPPPDSTGAYAVFTGERSRAEIGFPSARLELANLAGPLPATPVFLSDLPAGSDHAPTGWLSIKVGFLPLF